MPDGPRQSNRAVYKSAVVDALDDFLSGDAEVLRARYEYALRLLDENTSLAEIMEQLESDGRRSAEFVPAGQGSALVGRQFDEVTRRGYTAAIDLALGHEVPVPVETLWMTGVSDEFEMHVCDGDRQVTVLVLVPEARQYGSERARSASWIVTEDGELEQVSGQRGRRAPRTESAP